MDLLVLQQGFATDRGSTFTVYVRSDLIGACTPMCEGITPRSCLLKSRRPPLSPAPVIREQLTWLSSMAEAALRCGLISKYKPA